MPVCWTKVPVAMICMQLDSASLVVSLQATSISHLLNKGAGVHSAGVVGVRVVPVSLHHPALRHKAGLAHLGSLQCIHADPLQLQADFSCFIW